LPNGTLLSESLSSGMFPDPWSAIRFGLVAAKLLIDPASAGQIAGGAVLAYSLTATAVRHLRASGAGA
jgi:hypothetical protein